MSHRRPFDPGLQPERTSLAWRRTALSLAIASLVSIRILPDHFDQTIWMAPGIVGVIAAGALWAAAHRRFHGFTDLAGPATSGHPRLGAVILLILTVCAACAGILGAVVVLSTPAD